MKISLKEKRLEEKRLLTEHKTRRDAYKESFTEMIAVMFSRQMDTKYVIHCGKTNSGKTYQAIQALKRNGSGVYLAPLRLLAWEIYDRLNQDGYPCSLVTGEEQIDNANAPYVSSTIEMLDYGRAYDTVVIDEAFYIGDKDRGKSWIKAILECNAREVHIIVNEEALMMVENILKLTKRIFEVKRYEMLQQFKFSSEVLTLGKNHPLPKGGVFVTFSRIGALIFKMKLEKLNYKVSVLYGNLPPEVKKKQIESFINGENDLMVCTDVIGAGVNVPANYLVFIETSKYDGVSNRRLLPMEVRQIAGRCGRYGLSSKDSFVTAMSKADVNYIRQAYSMNTSVDMSYLGFDFNMFSMFPEDFTVEQRVKAFREIDFIPNQLKKYITKESISKYLELADFVDKKEFTLDVKWAFLTAPVKKNNMHYFQSCIRNYAHNCTINPPSTQADYYEIQNVEDNISEIELYMNLTRTLNHDGMVKEKMKATKERLTEKLQTMLLDKKLSHNKKCKLCSEYIPISDPYQYCGECYETKVRSSYGYNSWF